MTIKKSLGNSATGVQHSVEIDGDGDGFTVIEHTPTSVEKIILDQNAEMRATEQNKRAHMRHAAQIPIGLYQLWRKEWRQEHSDRWEWNTFLAMRLNSRDYSHLRTGYKRGGAMKL